MEQISELIVVAGEPMVIVDSFSLPLDGSNPSEKRVRRFLMADT